MSMKTRVRILKQTVHVNIARTIMLSYTRIV